MMYNQKVSEEAEMNNKIKYIVIDVDGTMTDGGIFYDEHGNEVKRFSTKDAAGVFAAHAAGIVLLVITGRECQATIRRLNELGIKYVFQNIRNKREFLHNYMVENHITSEEIGYIGDDLNDYYAMKLASFIGCPSDGCSEIKEIASYISRFRGGDGAVRDVIEYYLRDSGEWKSCIEKVYDI